MAMGLSAQDRQALDFIEDRLAASDPKLASMLATFSRLTAEEAMPLRENIHPVLRSRRRRRRGPTVPVEPGHEASGARNRRCWRRQALALWFVITLALVGAALAAIHAGGGLCPPRARGCAVQAPVHRNGAQTVRTTTGAARGLSSVPASAAGNPGQ
jgi:hypothetical protein